MELTKGNRKIEKRPLSVGTIAADYDVLMISQSGDSMAINRADFVTALTGLGLGGSTTGSDGVFDCGDRMTGNEVHNMGNRV